jgi:Zn-dependent protease with chaperone function
MADSDSPIQRIRDLIRDHGFSNFAPLSSQHAAFEKRLRKICAENKIPIPLLFEAEHSTPKAALADSEKLVFARDFFTFFPLDEQVALAAHELAHLKLATRHQLMSALPAPTAAAAGAAGAGLAADYISKKLHADGEKDTRRGFLKFGARLAGALAGGAAAYVPVQKFTAPRMIRTRELEADEVGAILCGDREAMIRALERVQSKLGDELDGANGGYPSYTERINKLKEKAKYTTVDAWFEANQTTLLAGQGDAPYTR